VKNEFYQTISGSVSRDQMLHRLSLASSKVSRQKFKQASTEKVPKGKKL